MKSTVVLVAATIVLTGIFIGSQAFAAEGVPSPTYSGDFEGFITGINRLASDLNLTISQVVLHLGYFKLQKANRLRQTIEYLRCQAGALLDNRIVFYLSQQIDILQHQRRLSSDDLKCGKLALD